MTRFFRNYIWAFLTVGLFCSGLTSVQVIADEGNNTVAVADTNQTVAADALEINSAWGLLKTIFTYELKLGAMRVSLNGVLLLLLMFGLVIVLEKVIRERVIMRIFEKTDFPEALEYGIARIMGYAFMVIGFYLAFQVAGIDLSSLAFIAGAVGVGIGFGLQNIINNFVSGIIIYAEHPITIGDRIEVGGIAGRVEKISLRSTMVVTSDNITMIVPNADFISQTVTNWSYSDPKVRIRVPIGVAYGTDPEKVKKLLLEVADEDPRTLKDPKPSVIFRAFGASSLDFELASWTKEMTTRPTSYISAINFAIDKKFREHDIEIPFPQQDLHIRSGGVEIKKVTESGKVTVD